MTDARQHPGQDAVMTVLAAAERPLTVTELSQQAGVTRPVVRRVLTRLDSEGRLDVHDGAWPRSYALRPAETGGQS
jgi:DNA-binding FadR family transcriptional regulator